MIHKLFQFDFRDFFGTHPKLFRVLSTLTVVLVLVSLIFTVYDLGADNASSFTNLVKEQGVQLFSLVYDSANTQHLFILGVAAAYLLFGFTVSLFDLYSIRRAGQMKRFLPVFFAHLSSSILILFLLDTVFAWVHIPFKQYFLNASTADAVPDHPFLIDYLFDAITRTINAHVPTIIYTTPVVAFFLSLLVGSFFEYGIHWLDHNSRFLWLVNHRIHHTSEYMHPMGVGVVDVFPKLFVGIPKVLFFSALSKLFYNNALFEYFLAFNILYIFTQYFNHSTTYYEYFSNKPWLQRLLFIPHANGTYHYMHHSAVPGDESVNLSSGGFMIWDKVFGTFRSPYMERPPVGLTNNPDIKLNPFALVFSGWQQLGYEWKHNPDWAIRRKILFGNIWYMPPVTKDFLKLKN